MNNIDPLQFSHPNFWPWHSRGSCLTWSIHDSRKMCAVTTQTLLRNYQSNVTKRLGYWSSLKIEHPQDMPQKISIPRGPIRAHGPWVVDGSLESCKVEPSWIGLAPPNLTVMKSGESLQEQLGNTLLRHLSSIFSSSFLITLMALPGL